MSDTQSDTPVVYPSSVFASPVGWQSGDVDNNNAQITDVWTISDHLINEARMGYTYQGNFFADLTLGQGLPAKLGWQYAKADSFPGISVGPYNGIGPASNAVYKEHVFDPSDVVTLVRGKHILHFGGELLLYRDDSTAWGNTNAGSFNFSGQYTQHWSLNAKGIASPDTTTGLNYADFLLGDAQSWSAKVQPEYGARLKGPQVFIQDDYKLRPNLTVNLGLRYQIRHGWNEIRGNELVFDPTVLNPATATLGAAWFGSTKANGRSSLQADVYNTFLPRVGFAWQPDPNTTVRGGFGIYAYNWSLDTYGNGVGNAFGSSGNQSDQTNGITPITTLSGTGANLAYIPASTNPAAYNGTGNLSYNQYHTPIPEIYQWNLALQHELGANMVAELAYVASHGYNLNFPVDINQVPENKLGPNDSPADRPYPQFQGLGGSTNNAISNYNSLQASISRRLSSGLAFNFNYVWSHFLDDQDSSGWGSRAGQQNYQNAYAPSENYANSNFDVRNAFKGNIIYDLPFGHGRRFINNNWILDEIVGGWQASGTLVLSTGNPFTVFSDGNTFAQAGTQYPNLTGVSTKPVGGRNINEWYNPAAFSLPDNGTYGNAGRNSVTGPGLDVVNISAGKRFAIYEQVKLQIRIDAANAFNHPSFYIPQQYLNANPGTNNYIGSATNITGTTVGGRNVQLGVRLEF